MASLLRYVAGRTLEGSSDLKEYVIGTEVFGRDASYNPQDDPTVRIMAGRLRAKLAEYYHGPGREDAVLIELPRGGYQTTFTVRREAAAAPVRMERPRALAVGRSAEAGRLAAIYQDVLRGAGYVVCIAAEAGMGKTTFAEEFLAGIAGADVLIARGRCSERLAEAAAFGPVLEALDELRRGSPDAAQLMEELAPSWHDQLVPRGGGGLRTPSYERTRREFATFLEGLAARRPVVLLFDDMHWADASTCDLLAHLSQRLKSMRLLIVATFRSGALQAPGQPFLPVKLRLEREGLSREIVLPLLAAGDVVQFIDLRFPENFFPPEFSAIVWERTEGHPLFLSDLLRFLEDTQAVARDGRGWRLVRGTGEVRRRIPTGTQAMITAKLSHLDEQDQAILLRAAVQGLVFDSAVVAEALQLDPALVEERLRRLEEVHRLITMVEEQERPGLTLSVRYRFTHVLYQNSLYQSLTPTRRAVESLQVASALARAAGETAGGMAAELALLYETGRDAVKASQHFLQAARNAARVFAYPETALLCERGQRSLLALPASRQRDEQELMFALTMGMALMSTRGFAAPEVETTYRRARELCLGLHETRRLITVLWALHTGQTNAGNLTESLKLALEMQEAATEMGTVDGLVQSLHATGTTLAFMGRLTEARKPLERILEVAPPSRHEFRPAIYVLDPMVTSLSMLGRTQTLMGDYEAGMATARAALDLATRLGHPHSQAYAVFWIGWILQTRGDWQGALPHLETAMGMGRAQGMPSIVEWGRVVHGSALAHLGRLEEGIAAIRLSIERQDMLGARLERPYCLVLLADALLAAGQTGEALRHCVRAVELGEATGARSFEAEAHRLRAEALLAEDNRLEGERAIVLAMELARAQGCRLLEDRVARSVERTFRGVGMLERRHRSAQQSLT
ncbi:MAG: hypothetical protein FJW40_07235 [Acidobacteria bacterium]|nr:hypothetical protein [Acidobacteriota bacterium]